MTEFTTLEAQQEFEQRKAGKTAADIVDAGIVDKMVESVTGNGHEMDAPSMEFLRAQIEKWKMQERNRKVARARTRLKNRAKNRTAKASKRVNRG